VLGSAFFDRIRAKTPSPPLLALMSPHGLVNHKSRRILRGSTFLVAMRFFIFCIRRTLYEFFCTVFPLPRRSQISAVPVKKSLWSLKDNDFFKFGYSFWSVVPLPCAGRLPMRLDTHFSKTSGIRSTSWPTATLDAAPPCAYFVELNSIFFSPLLLFPFPLP